MPHHDLLILGAGAAGLMAAAHLPSRTDALILEHNPSPAAKIAISGGGRCNITNATLAPERYLGDPSFIAAIFDRFDNRDLLRFLRRHGLEPVIRKEGQYFCHKSARELIDLLLAVSGRVPVRYGVEVTGARKEGELFVVQSDAGSFRSKRLLVATGGLSYPSVGASGIGLSIAESFGHTVVPPRPALVGLTLQPEQFWMKELSGLSVPVEIAVGRRRIGGDLLFAHRGISGPAVLDASLWWNRGAITIDFLPGVRLRSLFRPSGRRASLQIPLPRRLVGSLFRALDLPDIPYAAMDEAQKQRLSRIKSYPLSPAGTFGYARAEATKGGVDTSQIDPKTMQSRLVDGLFFAGEVVDVTGEVGGYNFQWAFSSAVVAAKSV
ncbi:NAD(P)/FAD-dependent oxidoreductase [Hydrogenimonas sp.]